MHKILVEAKAIPNPQQTPYRKIIILPQTSNRYKDPQPSIISGSSQMIGFVHLFKKYQGQTTSKQSGKSNLTSNQIDIKTHVLFLSQLLSSELPALKKHFSQRSDSIQSIDTVWEDQHPNSVNIIVYLNNSLVCEQLYHLCLVNFNTLPLYIKQAVFVTTQSPNQNNKECLHLVNNCSLRANTQKDLVYDQQWIQIPRCITCLEKLEYELTGISSQLFLQLSKANRLFCSTCETISKVQLHKPTACSLCQSSEDNWMCMVCSRIGCGRYKKADAFKHFLTDGHIITMDLQTQRVWNYLSDCFSHRVIPLQKQEITLKFPDYSHQKHDAKYEQSLQSAFWEYCSVVSQQLQRQRIFYEKQRQQQQQKNARENAKMNGLLQQLHRQIQQKAQVLKKMQKKQKKGQKRLEQLKQKCKLDREILANYEKAIKQETKQEGILEIQKRSDKIQQKLRILDGLDTQINSILVKLTQ